MLPYQKETLKEGGIAIMGIGGAGANVLKCFNSSSADNVRLYTLSLDERVGRSCGNVEFVQLGEGLSHGLGSGGDPAVGRQAMEESEGRVREALQDCKLLVLVVGLGGGTGSGAAPVLARLAHEEGIFLVSVVMMPFNFEGKRRREQAELAHEEIARLSDIVFCFENDYMEELFRNRTGARAVFEEVDRLLAKATASVPMIATSPGLINLGLDELAVALENHDSRCIFGSGSGYGATRAQQAAQSAIDSPLATYHGALRFARTAIVHIAGGESLSITEIRQTMEVIQDALGSEDVQIFFGASVKPNLGDEIRVTLIASIDAQEFQAAYSETETPLRPDEEDSSPSSSPTEEETVADSSLEDEPGESEEDEGEPREEDEEEVFNEDEDPFPDDDREDEPEEETDELPEDDSEDEPVDDRSKEDEKWADKEELAPERERPIPPAARREARQMDLFSTPVRREESLPVRERRTSRLSPSSTYEDSGIDDLPPHFDPAVQSERMSPGRSSRVATGRQQHDDIDTPPSLRLNDLRNIFPDN